MTNRTDQLNELFDEWERRVYRLPGNDGPFIRDGIIDEEKWNSCNQRILFMLKEINPGRHEGLKPCYNNDFRKNCYQEPWTRLGLWTNVLLYGEALAGVIDGKKYERWRTVFLSTAVMNLKKTPGVASTDWDVLRQYAKGGTSPELLRKQLEIIDPTIVVCCGRAGETESVFNIAKEIGLCNCNPYPAGKAEDGVFKTYVFKESGSNRLWIDFYHPSRRIKGMTYERLASLLRLNNDGLSPPG